MDSTIASGRVMAVTVELARLFAVNLVNYGKLKDDLEGYLFAYLKL